MLYKITDIEFDFDGEEVSEDEAREYTLDAIGEVYDVEDGDELVDCVSDAHGWCIKSIDYFPICDSE